MTFAEYNTDENYDNKNGFESSLEELVKLGLEEGKTSDDIKSSLSPKWQKSKKIDEFDNYVSKYSKPKEEKKETEKPKEEAAKETTEIPKKTTSETEEFIDNQNNIANMAEDKERERQRKELKERWDTFNQNADKMAQSMRSIDDHAIENLPTFIFRRYQNNEFGDLSTEEGKKDAKLRMAYFMINGIGTALQNASASIKGGAMQQSDYEKYKESNLANALENRWSKYRQEMNSAMDLAKQRGMSEEALTDSIATISSNNRLQSAANMMNEEQKVFAFEVLAEIGGNLGNMNNPDFVNTLMGMSAMNKDLDPKEAAAMLVYRFGKDPNKVKDFINGLGFDLDGIKETVGSGETKTSSIAGNGNLKGYQTIDGDTVDFEFMFTKGNGGKERLQKLAQDLSEKYYKGEIDEATFRKYFTPLYEEGKKHTSVKVFSPDSVINDNNTRRLNELNSSYDELNRQAKNGEISVKDYNEQYADLIANANKWGASKKYLDALNKNKIADNKIEAAINKKSKKK